MKKISKLILGFIIAFTGIVLSGCVDQYADLRLSPSVDSIEVEVGGKTSFEIDFKNYNNNMSFNVSLNSENNFVKATNYDYSQKGKVIIEVEGLSVGNESLIINSWEGSKSCVITAKVFESVTDFELKELLNNQNEPYKIKPFVLKEDGFVLNLSETNYFDFIPEKSYDTVSFYFNENGEEVKVQSIKTIREDDLLFVYLLTQDAQITVTTTSFELTAKLDKYTNVEGIIVQFDVIEPIQVNDLNIIKQGYGNDYLNPSEFIKLENNDEIILISNDDERYSYFEIELEILSQNVDVEISASKPVISIPNLQDFDLASPYSYVFGLQSGILGVDELIITLSYEFYEGYEIVYNFTVNTVSMPDSIEVNSKASFDEPIYLYDTYDDRYSEAEYFINIAVYALDSVFDSISFSFVTNNYQELNDWSEFVRVVYKNQLKTDNFLLDYSDFVNNFLNSPISLLGNKQFGNELYIKLVLNESFYMQKNIVYYIPIVIEEGAESFDVTAIYANGLSLNINHGTKNFEGLVIKKDTAYIGNFVFDYINNSDLFFEVEQVLRNQKSLRIIPKSVGQGVLRIFLPNGLSVDLTIKIENALSSANLSVTNSKEISLSESDGQGNIEYLAINYAPENISNPAPVKLNFKLLTNPTNATLYNIVYEIIGQDLISFDKNTFVLTVKGVGSASLKITLELLEVESFEKFNTEQKIEFNVAFDIYYPVKSFDFVENGHNKTSATVFKSGDVGYKYAQQGLSKVEIDLKAVLHDNQIIDDIFLHFKDKISWITELGIPEEISSSVATGKYMSTGKIDNFGEYEINGNHLVLNCNNPYAKVNTTFWIAFTISEFNLNKTAILNITISNYVPLYSVGFYNYTDEVYLSDANPVYKFNTFLNPLSDCQEFDVTFEPKDGTNNNIISIAINSSYSEVTIKYNRSGTGHGTLYFIPLTSYTEATTAEYYTTINVRVSDGSKKNNPLIINSAEEFVSTMEDRNSLDKHYKITTTLDFENVEIPGFAEFKGTIIGASASAKLINVKITNVFDEVNNNYIGLFSKLSESAEIKNLIVEGSINVNYITNNNVYAGFIAGENKGVIENVSIILKQSTITIKSQSPNSSFVCVGGVIGTNNGLLVNKINETNYNHTIINQTGKFEVRYQGYSPNAFVGGVAGENKSLILRENNGENNFYNQSIYGAMIDISTVGINSTGGVVGINNQEIIDIYDYTTSTIDNLLIVGNINASRYEIALNNFMGGSNVGGIVGTNDSYILNCISRVNVNGYNYVGGIAGVDKPVIGHVDVTNPENYAFISNCSVQATFLNSFKYLLTADSSLGNIGAISGNETSVIKQSIYPFNGNTAYYYYDINTANKIYPIAYSYNGLVYEHIKYDQADDLNNLFKPDDKELSVSEILPEYTLGAGKLVAENPQFKNKVAYMFYYEAVNTSEQEFINNLNSNRKNPFVFVNSNSLVLISQNMEILKIEANGNITLVGTGLAKVLVKSLLSSEKHETYVYIYVTNAFDGFEIKSENYALTSGSTVVVYESIPVNLSVEFNNADIETRNSFQQLIWVKTKSNNSASIDFSIKESESYVEIITSGNSLVLKTSSFTESDSVNMIKFFPKFTLSFNLIGQVYMQFDDDYNEFENLITRTEKEINIASIAKRGTEAINVGFSETTVEPLDEITLEVEQITDYPEDSLTIKSVKVGEEDGNTDYFIVLDCEGYNYSESDNVYKYNGTSGKFYIRFNYEKYALSVQDYIGTYYINLIADNFEIETIIVHLEKQQVMNVLTKNYYNVGTIFNASQKEEDYVASGANNLISLDIYPYFAEFDYVKIENSSMNYINGNSLIFEVVKLDSQNKFETIYGVNSTQMGINIPAKIIKENAFSLTSSKIYIKYTTTSTAQVDTNAEIIISVVKILDNNQEEIRIREVRPLSVIIKDTVSFTILDKTEINGKYYVAKGLQYELELNIYGFTEEQVKIEIFPGNATINKINGTYYLNIESNIHYASGQEGYGITIYTYGESVLDGIYFASEKTVLNLMVVDYVILTENINPLNLNMQDISDYNGSTIIKDASMGSIKTAIGNTVKLGTEFLYGLTVEYDRTNSSVANLVQEFNQVLTYNGDFGIIASQLRVAGDYITKLKLTPGVSVATEYLRISSSTGLNNRTQYSITPIKINTLEDSVYYFTYTGGFYYLNGLPTFDKTGQFGTYDLSTHFMMEVYSTGTESNSIPIYSYADLINMHENGWYILMNDLSLPANFTPIKTKIAGFNGNGYNIHFPIIWNVVESENIGLFGEVHADTVLKNITIKISTSTRVEINSAVAINFGFIAGQNSGSITNCAVVCNNIVTATVSISGQSTSITDNYVAGLVGYNRGYITNSQVEMILVGSANVAGFVGVNEKYISSSYVKNSRIVNSSADILRTAGFVVKNGVSITTDAHISSSFISGEFSATTIYSQGDEKVIKSNTHVAGFVYDNYAKISDCYSNIPIHSNSIRSGFVFNNAGVIKNTYSTSIFGQVGQLAYGYIVNNSIQNEEGTIENSFYLLGTVNKTVNKTTLSGVKSLSESEFNVNTLFDNFIISDSLYKTEGVWFYPSRNTELEFIRSGEHLQFIYGKLELVSPNIKADSKKSLDAENITVDPISGETTYLYIETRETEGSLNNPFIISSAKDFEDIMQFSSNRNINSNYFRIISFIDYEVENIISSELYKTVFKGMLEGNNMTISGFVIDTKEKLTNGGLFSKIGSGSTGEGCVKNLKLVPKYINMPNTSNVGTLAGSLESGKLYNLQIDGFGYSSTEGVVIIGHYCVGGVTGVAINNFAVKNILSSVSVRASYTSSTTNIVGIFTTKKTTGVSYSGAIFGVTNNSGLIYNVNVNNNLASMAEIAGLVFGKVGTNVTAKNINILLNENQSIGASVYGGIIAGENCGMISDIEISGTTSNDFFRSIPILPIAVGGVVGLMYSGSLQNINCNVDFSWINISPKIVGGIVGEMLGGNILNATFGGNINITANAGDYPTTGVITGGIVGKITYQPTVTLSSNITASASVLNNCKTTNTSVINVTTNSVYKIYVGGLIGQIINTYKTLKISGDDFIETAFKTTLNGCLNQAKININSTIFDGTMFTYVGGLIGGAFADMSENYAGEVIIYDNLSEQGNNFASSSEAYISVSIKDLKTSGVVTLRYGGILGFGYPVSELTRIQGVPTTYFGFGQMLGLATKALTAPDYFGQYALDEDGNLIKIPRMQDTSYLLINIFLKNPTNIFYEQNNYWRI